MMTQKKHSRDPVIAEIHRTREQMAEKFDGDIAAILEDARNRQAASGRPTWRGPSSKKGNHPRTIRAPEKLPEPESDV
jgi:hypothetical protein